MSWQTLSGQSRVFALRWAPAFLSTRRLEKDPHGADWSHLGLESIFSRPGEITAVQRGSVGGWKQGKNETGYCLENVFGLWHSRNGCCFVFWAALTNCNVPNKPETFAGSSFGHWSNITTQQHCRPHRSSVLLLCTPCCNLIFPAGCGSLVRFLTVIHGLTFWAAPLPTGARCQTSGPMTVAWAHVQRGIPEK